VDLTTELLERLRKEGTGGDGDSVLARLQEMLAQRLATSARSFQKPTDSPAI
jgi:hypothetical protein